MTKRVSYHNTTSGVTVAFDYKDALPSRADGLRQVCKHLKLNDVDHYLVDGSHYYEPVYPGQVVHFVRKAFPPAAPQKYVRVFGAPGYGKVALYVWYGRVDGISTGLLRRLIVERVPELSGSVFTVGSRLWWLHGDTAQIRLG